MVNEKKNESPVKLSLREPLTALDFAELPKLASRRQRYYPEDEHMKDNLRIKCLSHYKTTRTAAGKSVPPASLNTTFVHNRKRDLSGKF